MTASASTCIADPIVAKCAEYPGRSPPLLTLKFCDLKRSFRQLVSAAKSLSSRYRADPEHIDELDYLRSLDMLTDQLHEICGDLSTLRSSSSDHLKLKISALLYLLPEESEVELKLAQSLLADLEESQFELSASRNQ